jgi:ABC-2 type transport system permease protein
VKGTRTLLRLGLRLDRVRLIVWVLVIGLTPMITAAQYKKLYPTAHDLQGVSSVVSNASLEALAGPLFQVPSGGVSIGSLTAWKIGVFNFILVAVMSILTVVRHSRTEEETGRLELVGSTVVGRYAPLSAALALALLADAAAAVLTTLGLLGVGMPAPGSVALGLATGLSGLVFAAVAAVAAQLTQSGRGANSIGFAVLGAAYLLRALGDTGPTWLSWISPLGWALRIRAFAGEVWWVALLSVALAAIVGYAGYALVSRRDVGAGLLPERPAPAQAAPSLRSPWALAWRLQAGTLIGWVIAMALAGAVLGGAAKGISNFTANQQLSDMLARMGGTKGLVDAYLGAAGGIVGFVAACYTVQATLRLRAEESAGHVEPLLATGISRARYALSHLVFALLGTAVILAVSGLGAGLAYGVQIRDVGGQVGRLLAATMVQLPATWVLAGLGAALFGLVPRFAALAWAGLVACVALFELGALLGLSQWIVDASPFAHVPKLPGATFTAMPLVWLTVVAVALGAAGLVGFRRRDIG